MTGVQGGEMVRRAARGKPRVARAGPAGRPRGGSSL
jgi:hypothetical protein